MSQPASPDSDGPYVKNGRTSDRFMSTRIDSRHRQLSASDGTSVLRSRFGKRWGYPRCPTQTRRVRRSRTPLQRYRRARRVA
jgi:hypothetical protein